MLLGFDARVVNGKSHCHDDYAMVWPSDLYPERVLPMWSGWNQRMLAKGVKVLNASPGSAIEEFERAPLSDLIRRNNRPILSFSG